MTQVRIAVAGKDVAHFLQARWPPAKRSRTNVPRFHPDVTLVNTTDQIIKNLHRDPVTGDEFWGPPQFDPASSATFIVRVPDEADRIETIRAACRLLDGVTAGLVRAADALSVEIEPRL